MIIVQCVTFLCLLLYNYKHWIFYCMFLDFHLLYESMVGVSSVTIVDCHFPLFLHFKFICNKSYLLKVNCKLVYILDFYLFSSDVIHYPKCCLYFPKIYNFPTYLYARVFSGVWAQWTCHGPAAVAILKICFINTSHFSTQLSKLFCSICDWINIKISPCSKLHSHTTSDLYPKWPHFFT